LLTAHITGTLGALKRGAQMSRWQNVLSIHPAAELLPSIAEADLEKLGHDIRQHGLRNLVTIFEGQLIDGRSRLDAMEMVGMPTTKDGEIDPAIVKKVEGIEPNAYVLSQNIHRRHLTSKQKRELIAKLLKTKPEASNNSIAEQAKADDKTVNAVRKDLEGSSEIPSLEKRTGSNGRKQAAKKKSTPTKTKPDATFPVHFCKGREQPARKPKGDPALDHFTAHVCDLLQKIGNHKPERFAKTAVSADDLKKLSDFFLALANLKMLQAA
jgi:hypothetical protein